MAKKKQTKGSTDSSGAPASRIEFVTPPAENQAHIGRIGLGLVLSFPLGWGPLTDSFAGRGAYEVSMSKFLAVVGACVIGTTLIGKLLDAAPPETPLSLGLRADEATADTDGLASESATATANSEHATTDKSGLTARNDSMEHQNAPLRS